MNIAKGQQKNNTDLMMNTPAEWQMTHTILIFGFLFSFTTSVFKYIVYQVLS